jgi:hypothetical protein
MWLKRYSASQPGKRSPYVPNYHTDINYKFRINSRPYDTLKAAATTYAPHDFVGGNGSVTTFENLGWFENWSDAYDCIANAAVIKP